MIPALGNMAGVSSARSALYRASILSGNTSIVVVQVMVIAAGTLAAGFATWRITGRELAPISRNRLGLRLATTGLVLACGLAAAFLYVIMHAAD